MCGFAGFLDYSSNSSLDELKQMTTALQHRGPDDFGYEIFNENQFQLGFGFRRLSIIDLSPLGHQPMQWEEEKLSIVFNGEVYNYREIKDELVKLGYTFKSNSDTEVILKAYHKWGIDCLQKFIGMFAVALFDGKQKKFFLIRDRAGVKPLFYFKESNQILFASELKALHKHHAFKKEIDINALSLFFKHGYIPAPYSIFKNTFKVMPGTYLEFDLTNCSHKHITWWSVNTAYSLPKLKIDYTDAVNETEKLLLSAFKYRMIADVPVGIFLSGGYDSSCVAAMLQKNSTQKLKTFTIGFDDQKYNEANHARKVAEFIGTDHTEHYCTQNEAMDIIPMLPQIYDEPLGDPSCIPTTLVSRAARKQVTVALSADAGDEIFAGYPRHRHSLNLINKLNLIPGFAQRALSALVGIMPSPDFISKTDRLEKLKGVLGNKNISEVFSIINQTYSNKEVFKLFLERPHIPSTTFNFSSESSADFLDSVLSVEYQKYLSDDILHKVDRATMSVSLEGREPFLDHRIIEYVAQLPAHFKLNNGTGKYMLKEIVHKYIPPQIMERPKMGFGVPVETWCRNQLKDYFASYFVTSKIKSQGIFDAKQTDALLNTYMEGKLENFERIWFVFVFQLWYEKWMQ